MKILCRSAGITNTEVVCGTQLQKSFEPCTGGLRPLAFIAMRQKHCQPRSLFPFVLTGSDVLIDYRLRDVIKVAELGLPQHQRISRVDRITVFKTEDARFGKSTIEDFKAPMPSPAHCRKRRTSRSGLRVVQHRMSLTESATARILAAQTNVRSIDHQRAESNCFRKCPIHWQCPCAHLRGPRKLADHFSIE